MLASVALSSAAFLPGGLPGRSAVSSQAPRVAAVTMNSDYYSRLGVQKNADEKDIKNVSATCTQPASWHVRAAFPLLLARSLARPRPACPADAPPFGMQAYRKSARQWHPDVNPSEEAKEKFQSISEAYSVSSRRLAHRLRRGGRSIRRSSLTLAALAAGRCCRTRILSLIHI